MTNKKLIIIRGNSGSGKSVIAECLRNELGGKVAIIGQDALRRTMLKEKDNLENTDVIGLIEQTVTYCLDKGYTVIVEGILSKPKYKDVLVKLMKRDDCDNAVFYLDIPFEETLRRHNTKPVANDFGEKEMRSWYQPKNYLDVPGEVIIDENSTLEDAVSLILKTL